jgi:hypothetical protein
LIISNDFENKAITPNTNVIWVKTDPIESPTLIFPCPIEDAMMEFIISGRSVPNETRTNPINIGGMLQLHASATE